MRKLITIVLTGGVVFLMTGGEVKAEVRCETQYGGRQVCEEVGPIVLDKKVWDPVRGIWVDNLGMGNRRFVAGEEVRFRLQIRNASGVAVNGLVVEDRLPAQIRPLGQTVFLVGTLEPGASQELEVPGRVTEAVGCVTNVAEAKIGADVQDRDTAQLCLERERVTELPVTGPEENMWWAGGSLVAVTGGFMILNLSRRLREGR